MVEAMVVLILLILILLMVYEKKNSGDHAAAHGLINKLKEGEKNNAIKRGEMIATQCDVDPGELNEIMNNIGSKERELYKKIIQVFLSQDGNMLMQIGQYIDNLAEPYISIAGISTSNKEVEAVEIAKIEINRLKQESAALRKELVITTDSMEKIIAEYTRVFSGSQTELALKNSSKKMFEIFRNTDGRLRQAIKNIEIENL